MATREQQLAGLSRRKQRFDSRVEWLGDRLTAQVNITMRNRVRLAAQLLRDRVVINLSTPVHKERRTRNGRTVTVVTERSRPGEFPRADTTRLMKDIYYEMRTPMDSPNHDAIVGTTLAYGLALEVQRNRSFLVRTFNESLPLIRRILTQGGGAGTGFGAR